MFKKILLAADGSENSIRAAENAIKISTCSTNSIIEIVYVVDPETVKSEILSNWSSVKLGDIRRKQVSEIERMVNESGVSYEIKILQGEPGPVIVDYANKNNFDIVIIGSRGLSGLQEFVLGSVSHKVAQRAKCPVLIVK